MPSISPAGLASTFDVATQLWDGSPLGVLTVGPAGTIGYSNQAARVLVTGDAEGCLNGRPVAELFPGLGFPDQRSSGSPQRSWQGTRAHRPDGSYTCVDVDVARGEPIIITLRPAEIDATDLPSPVIEAGFDAFLDTMPGYAMVKDVQGHWLYLNHAMAQVLGVPSGTALGSQSNELFPGYASTPLDDQDRLVLATGTPNTMRRTFDQGVAAVQLDMTKFAFPASDGSTLIGVLAADVTKQHLVEGSLAHHAELMDQMEQIARVGAWSLEIPDSVSSWSRGMFRIYGLADGVGQPPRGTMHLFPAEFRPLIESALDSAIATGEPWDMELPMTTVDGRQIWVRAIGVPKIENGVTARIVGALQDITDLRDVSVELGRLNEELEQRVGHRTTELEAANKELASFSYSISHDLRAPLRAISGFTSILQRRYAAQLDDKGRHYLDNVATAGLRMSTLIEALLDYSRLTRQPTRIQPVDIDRIIEGTLDLYEERALQLGARFIHRRPTPVVRGDPALIGQIIGNLIENALTYHCVGDDPIIEIESRSVADDIEIDVIDNGIGIGSAYHERIFEVFQRLHNDDEYPGTGIGLANVRKAARWMGGDVLVRSAPGAGSTFTIRLPAATDSHAPTDAARSAS